MDLVHLPQQLLGLELVVVHLFVLLLLELSTPRVDFCLGVFEPGFDGLPPVLNYLHDVVYLAFVGAYETLVVF